MQRTAVAFNGCFGWLHAPGDGRGNETAVLICPGLMKDDLLAHASFRFLADVLASAGLWVLRLDYRGTGDSADINAAPAGGHWQVWQDDVDGAVVWLRQQTGARRLILCGLRAGATLAALAAARRDDVAGLLLFDPVVSGRSYVRQLILEGNLQNGGAMPREEGLEIREFKFSAATVSTMADIDLRRLALHAGQKAAVFGRSDLKAIEACAAAWRAQGVETLQSGWEGLESLTHHPLVEEVPLAGFDSAMTWLRQSSLLTLPSASPNRPSRLDAVLAIPGCIETPISFGAGDRLFGILCRPDGSASDDAVVLTNGGRDPHYGSARQNVALARRLARAGIASLRFDFAGLGDSIGPPGKEKALSHTFTDRVPDMQAAIDALQATGFKRFALHGLCSGAYHAFQGALADPRVTGLLLINIAAFTLPDTDVADFLVHRGRSPQHFLRKLFRIGSWMTFFSGKTNVRSAVRGMQAHIRTRLVDKTKACARRIGLIREESFVSQAMARLSKRGVRILFLFSPGDEEIEAFGREFGTTGAGLAAYEAATMKVIPGMDHDLTKSEGRYDAETAIVDFFRR